MPKAGSTAAKANSAFWAKALGGDCVDPQTEHHAGMGLGFRCAVEDHGVLPEVGCFTAALTAMTRVASPAMMRMTPPTAWGKDSGCTMAGIWCGPSAASTTSA